MSEFNLSCSLEKFQKFADVTLKTEDGSTFKTHKVLLAQSSKYFEALFCGDSRCSQTLVPMVKKEVLQQILLYIFQKDDILTEKNVLDVILAADYLIMDELIARCKSFIFNGGCTIHNCIQVYDTARQIQMKDVKNKCRRFIQIHAAEVFSNSKNYIIDLSLDSFKEILECDNLNVRDETMVWEVIMLWIKGSISDRWAYFPELLKYVRFSELDESTSKLLDSSLCDINQSILGPGSVTNQTENLISLVTSERSPRIPNRVYLICKQARRKHVEMHITYDERLDYSYFVGKLSNKYYMPCTIVEQFVYFFSYYDGRKIHAFDLISQTWLPVIKFPLKLTDYKVVSVNGAIYVFGCWTFNSWETPISEDDSENEENDSFIEDSFDDSSVEEMGETDPETEEESDGVSIEEENIMIIDNDTDMTEEDVEQINDILDDLDPESLVDIVLRYNRETDSWRLMSPMIPASVLNAVVLNNSIFVIAKSKDFNEQVCQVYNTITDTWVTISNPRFYRSNYCTTAVFNGNLYLIGGQDKAGLDIGKVEEYSPATHLWRTLPDLPSVCHKPATVIINNTLIVYDKGRIEFWEDDQFKGNPRSVFWDSEKEIWCDANTIHKDSLMELRFYNIYPMDDINVLKELSKKHKREESVWCKSALADLDLDELTIGH